MENYFYLRYENDISDLIDKKFPEIMHDILHDFGNFVHVTRYCKVFDDLRDKAKTQKKNSITMPPIKYNPG